jgi:hypothetical protein
LIDKDQECGTFEVSCDTPNCNSTEVYDVDNEWDELLSQMKQNGWVSRYKNGEWFHYCPDCTGQKRRND